MGEELIRRALADEACCAPDARGLWARMWHRLTRRRVALLGLGAIGAVVLAAGVGLWCRRRRGVGAGWCRRGG